METQRELLKGSTPTLVLAVLREEPLHGYAIAREIEQRSGKSLRCKEGTLYPVLHSLEQQGLITGGWEPSGTGRPRKVYRLTEAGLVELENRTRTWTEFAAAVQRVLTGGDHEPAHPTPQPENTRHRSGTPGPLLPDPTG